jgi:ribosome-binding ATPase
MPCIGFFGLPGSGKSTVFHALTHQAVAPQYLTADLKPHQAMVKIPDSRLEWLSAHYKTRSTVHASTEFLDIPGFDPASTERKLMTAVLEHYRRVDALALVVKLFEDAGSAAAGMQSLLDELLLLDLLAVEKQAASTAKAAMLKADHDSIARRDLLARMKTQLEDGVPVRRMGLPPEEERLIRELGLLSGKPLIAVLNVADDDLARSDVEVPGLAASLMLCAAEGIAAVRMAASLEAALADMAQSEAAEYMAEYGVSEAALPRFIRVAFDCLGLITYLTGSDKECRAWPLRQGANAQQAAGVIHSDLARGFIRAETVAFSDLVQYGDMAAAKAAGKVRLEGKEYIVADGDILHIRFNV